MRYITLFILIFAMSTTLEAQNLRERGEVRRGNKEFVGEQYEPAAEHYLRAVEYDPANFEARYNLGSALIKGGNLEQGEALLAELAADSLQTDINRSNAYFNLGNSQFEQQKLQEALESYKDAMRYDPTDQEAKYNYAYTKALLEQNEDQEQDQDQENQDGDGEGEDQQDQQDQEQNEDQNEDQEQDQQPQDQDEQEQDEQEQQQPQPTISEQEQQQMLDAIQAQEDKTQEDLKEAAQGVLIPGNKNW